jgi:hypothetical protein
MEHQDKVYEPPYYQIKIAGHLDKSWSAWLNCMAIACETDENTQAPVTVLTCPITDQPALRGLLNKLFDLNLMILSVIGPNPDADQNHSQGTQE